MLKTEVKLKTHHLLIVFLCLTIHIIYKIICVYCIHIGKYQNFSQEIAYIIKEQVTCWHTLHRFTSFLPVRISSVHVRTTPYVNHNNFLAASPCHE